MRRLALLLCGLLLVAGLAAQPGAAATATPKTQTKLVCHWIKATKKVKRHKVCFKRRVPVKHAAPAKPAAPSGSTSSPASSAPAASIPGATPTAPAATTPGAVAGGFTETVPAAATPAAVVAPVVAAPIVAPARLQVTSREWSLVLSRASVAAGPLIAQLVNRGEDAHDLHVRPAAGGDDVLVIGETASTEVTDGPKTTLAAGTYTLYCSLEGHEAAGMHATLTVK